MSRESRLEGAERIWIVGPPGSGKSTLARALADRMGIAPTHMDELHWLPGWEERAEEETAAMLASVVDRPRWVIDGNYSKFRDPHRDRIQLYVWLDLPLRTTFPRLLRRSLNRSLRRESCCNGNYESLRLTFLDRESLLLYALMTHRRRHRELAAKLAGRPHLRFRDPRRLNRWMVATRHAGGGLITERAAPQRTAPRVPHVLDDQQDARDS